MTNRPRILTAATAITLLIFGGTASASDNANLRFTKQINSCVAEVADHANYEDATRVRHIVVEEERFRLGYAFTIDTYVYTDSDAIAAREYSSYCVARGNDHLVRFRIDEVSS